MADQPHDLPQSSVQSLSRKRTRLVLSDVNVLVLDLRGVLTDWCTPVSEAIHAAHGDIADPIEFAIAWYGEIYAALSRQCATNQEKTLPVYVKMALDELIKRRGIHYLDEDERNRLCSSWMVGKAWPDAHVALPLLNKRFFTVALGIGSRSDIANIQRSSCITPHARLCATTPRESPWTWRLLLLSLELYDKPDMAALVSSHADSLRHAAAVGMRTIYLNRPWEDPDEDFQALHAEFDIVIDGTEVDNPHGGLAALAAALDLTVRSEPQFTQPGAAT